MSQSAVPFPVGWGERKEYKQKNADFNEATYGMQLTFELQSWLQDQKDLVGAAILPTLRDEAELGYDVKIPRQWGMLYLQFKMPEYMRGKNAAEHDTFGESYFRFDVKTDKTNNDKIQHNALCDLEDAGENVFYAAPRFLTVDEINEYALNAGMYANSVFPRPSLLGEVEENSSHRYGYTGVNDIRAFSEPSLPVEGSFDTMTESLRQNLIRRDEAPLERFVRSSLETLSEHQDQTLEPNADDRTALEQLLVLSNRLALQPFIVGRS